MENRAVANPLAGMDDNDEKKLYEMADEEDNANGFNNLKQGQRSYVINNSTPPPTSCWVKAVFAAIFFLILLVVLVLIMQGITVHQIITNPESSSASDTGVGGATDALRADPTTGYQCPNSSLDTDMIKQLQKSLDDSAAVTDMLLTYILNNTEVLGNNYDSTQNIVDSLVNMVTTLSNLEANSITTEALVNDVLSKVQTILSIQNATVPYSEPTSCQDIKAADPNSQSGYYHIHSQIVYCNMDELCGSTDGWSRVGYLDMNDATSNCPGNLKYRKAGNRRACGRPDDFNTVSGCAALVFSSHGIKYSKICGRVTGYQYGTTDSVSGNKNINTPYIDGVSITRGSPRQHVWTFIISNSKHQAQCPGCSTTTKQVQDFVGDDFFCESGNPNSHAALFKFYQNPIWDGLQCGSAEKDCCEVPGIPWFSQTIPNNGTTTDYIELRLCGNQGVQDEDALVGLYEIYIQ